jgi:protein farnesyltransferase subunit beta
MGRRGTRRGRGEREKEREKRRAKREREVLLRYQVPHSFTHTACLLSCRQQQETEEIVGMCVPVLPDGSGPADTTEMPDMRLHKEKHVKFCLEGLESLGQGYSCLDASRPWLTYWTIHSLAILDALPSDEICSRVVNFLGKCQSPKGGFCGGPGQAPHLAPTYAAINALATVGTPEAFAVIDRASLHSFLLSMKDPCGGFRMHEGGEIDVRGSYCALNSAFIAGVMTEELKSGCAQFIRDCMTYEGAR